MAYFVFFVQLVFQYLQLRCEEFSLPRMLPADRFEHLSPLPVSCL
jgi:hypothetical protein